MQTTAIVRPNATECAPPFVPSITVRNAGGETVTAFKTGYILNGGTPFIQAHNITLAPGSSTTVTFPSLNPPAGNNTIKMFVADPITASPGPDGTPANDTLVRTFAVPTTVTNVIQGFEGTTFIPANWVLLNPNNNVTWIRKTPGKGSDYSAFIDNYNNNTTNQLDIMQTPPVNTVGADGVTITFDVAHRDYPGSFDRLRVLVSANCGVSYTSVYSKSGPTLTTSSSSDQDFTDPLQNEWRTETISLNNTFTGGNLIVQFENRNDFGNNVFIDNINIVPVFKRDIEVLSVSPQIQCTPAFAPVATIRNRGTEAVTGFSVAYTIGAGAPVTTVVTGVNIAPGATTNVTLSAGTLAGGANSIKVYSFAPITASGTGDQYLLNDTIVRTASVAGSVTAPTNIVETFEGTTFAPSGWVIANPDNALTWQKASTGKFSSSSAFVRNFAYYTNGQRDALYTPVLNYTGVDSVNLSFDLSATTKDLPANAPLGLDTLEVLVTKDCGNTFTSVYKKWGDQLQTIGNSSFPQPTEFSPGTHPFLWRTETIDLTSYSSGGPLQVVFRNSTNNQNDVYIDNVNFRTVVLPPKLKADGVIVTPNPFSEQFSLWFIRTPTDLSYITVLNSAGQLVWNKVYNGNAGSNVLNINMSGMAAGVYILNLGYTDKSKDKQIKIIKSN
jgi:Secretion system C-terminal sorting domain